MSLAMRMDFKQGIHLQDRKKRENIDIVICKILY